MKMYLSVALASATVFAGLLLVPGVAPAEIGSVAAVNRDMQGTLPLAEKTFLVIGDTLVQDELIETTATGSGQLLFLDQTTLSIGPNSEVLIDRYVYDPDRGTGEIVLSVGKGVLRFIGGQITKNGDAVIHTPTASIGIRGSMAVIEVLANGDTKVTNLASSYVSVSQNCDDDGDGFDDGARCDGEPKSLVTISRAGGTALAGQDGVVYTGLASAEELGSAYAALEGSGTGGVEEPPTVVQINDGIRQLAPINSQSTGEPLAGGVFGSQDSDDPNSVNQTFNSIAQQSGGMMNDMNRPDPAVIAALTGTALYSGDLTATQTFFGDVPISQPSGGTFDMAYNFTSREGAIDFDVTFSIAPNGAPLNSIFTVDVAADPNNAAIYAGSDPIFGIGSTSAQGGFFTGQFEGLDDPRASTGGDFQLVIPDQANSEVIGTFEGPRTE